MPMASRRLGTACISAARCSSPIIRCRRWSLPARLRSAGSSRFGRPEHSGSVSYYPSRASCGSSRLPPVPFVLNRPPIIRGTDSSNPSPSAITEVLIKYYQYIRSYRCVVTHKSTRASFVDAGGLPWKILDACSWQPPVSRPTQSSAVAKISGLRSSLRHPQALTRRINSAQRSSTGKVFSAGSGGNVVTTRSTPCPDSA
jgi:hypothetical protein